MVRALYDALDLGERSVSLADTLGFVRAHPEISALNQHIEQKDPTK